MPFLQEVSVCRLLPYYGLWGFPDRSKRACKNAAG